MTQINVANYNSGFDLITFYISNDSEYSNQVISDLSSHFDDFKAQKTNIVILASVDSFIKENFPTLRPEQQGVIIADSSGKILWSKMDLSYSDLHKVLLGFTQNYNENSAVKDMFKWGNRIPDFGDYMCIDCGYVLSVEKNSSLLPGMVFPTCDVCQSGEPDGPSTFLEEFWQKI
jgi:hypothetical protein